MIQDEYRISEGRPQRWDRAETPRAWVTFRTFAEISHSNGLEQQFRRQDALIVNRGWIFL